MSAPHTSGSRRSLRRGTVCAVLLASVIALAATSGVVEARSIPDWLSRLGRAVSSVGSAARARAALADTTTIFGPRTFSLGSATSATFVEAFAISGTTAPSGYVLRVRNAPTQFSAVTGGTIALNGSVVVNGNDIAALPAGGTRDFPIYTTAADTIVAALQGPSGSGMQVSVLAVLDPTFAIFGPKTYQRGDHDFDVTETFAMPTGAAAPMALCVTNGTTAGFHRNAGSSVTLNGVEVIHPSDMTTAIGTLRRVVTFQASNTMVVHVAGASGSLFSLCATATDSLKPALTITAPVVNRTTHESPITILGTVADQTVTRVTVNGLPMTLTLTSPGHWSYTGPVPLTTEGANVLTFTAIDAAGNRTDSTRTVIRDTQAPVVTVTSLPDTAIAQTTTTVVVSGTITDNSAVTATVSGSPVTIDSVTHRYSRTVQLSYGLNFITVTAMDAGGNATSVVRRVTFDNVKPVITYTVPSEGLVTQAAQLHVVGNVADISKVTLKVNTVVVAVAASGDFSADVPLVAGANTIDFDATDALGNRQTASRHVTRDNTPPVVTVASPNNGTIVGTSTMNVTGTISDATAVTATLNGAPLTITTTGGFQGTVTLTQGANTLTVVATDAAGNVTTVVRQVTADMIAPALVVATPVNGSVTKQVAAQVSGTATAATAVSVTINGVPSSVGANGVFQSSVQLSEGSNSIVIIATQAAGLTTTLTRQVLLDTQAPSLSVTNPTNGTTTQTAQLLVSGTVSDATAVRVAVNGIAAPVSAGAFSATVTLTSGVNTIQIVATDSAGNATTQTRTVTLDDAQPANGFVEKVPIDRTIGAPAPAAGVVSTLAGATDFLYKGANPVQQGVAAGAITPARASVVRGRLLTRANQPLSGVTVRIADHPELGFTTSRSNGVYDMAVAAGATLTLTYARPGYISATRSVPTTWGEFTPLDDVIMSTADTIATQITFSAPIEVARGSVSQDSSGARRATLMFRQGTQAMMVRPDGSTQVLPSITVRATEFTVGPRGPEAMPASIAQNTAYTYAVDYSADEAAGATTVLFSKPIAAYTENFLGLPVGAIVPSGYYDTKTNSWKASTNGRVIKVLATTGGTATVDVAGAGIAASSDTLTAMGFDSAELAKLAELYQPGATLWRVPIPHFTWWDYNPSTRVIKKGTPPKRDDTRSPSAPIKPDPPTHDSNNECGCEIAVEDQTMGEAFPIANTPFRLHYSTSRTAGFAMARTIDVPLSGDSLLPEVQKIRLEISVAGRTLVRDFAAMPNQSLRYTWDGLDAYGRRLNGPQPITAKVSYYYPTVIGPAAAFDGSFGAFPGDSSEYPFTVPGRTLAPLSTEYKDYVGAWDARGEGLGAWTIDAHHVYDPTRKILYKGDGATVDAQPIGNVIRTAVGTGISGHAGDGGAATSATITSPGKMVALPDGSLVWTDQIQIRKVDSAGTISTIPIGFSAGLFGIAAGPDGSIYFGTSTEREYRVKPDGSVLVVAGGGGATLAEGVDALSIRDFQPEYSSRAIGPDGTLYLAKDNVIWRLAPDGKFYRAAGTLTPNCGAPVIEGPARLLTFCNSLSAFTIGPDNSIYVAEAFAPWIRRIRPDGIATLVTGGPNSTSQFNDGVAINARVNFVTSLEVSPDGTLLVAEGDGATIRQISPDGFIRTVAGQPGGTTLKEGDLATAVRLNGGRFAVPAKDGSIYLASGDLRIYRVAPALPGLQLGQFFIPASNGSEFYVFGLDGRHIATKDGLTLNDIFTFQYDALGNLSSITDAVGLVTTVTPGSNGTSASIVSGRGVRTTIDFDTFGYASLLRGPQNLAVAPQHDSLGLLRRFTNVRGFTNQFAYDSLGRLISDTDTLGTQSIAAIVTATKKTVSRIDAAGGVTSLTVEERPDRSVIQTRRIAGLDPDSSVFQPNGLQLGRFARMQLSDSLVADPRIGWPAAYSRASTYTLGSFNGLIQRSQTKVGGLPGMFGAGALMVDSTLVNGRLFIDSLDLSARRLVKRSPEGRRAETVFDAQKHVVRSQAWARAPRLLTYDNFGQVTSVAQNGAVDSIQWNVLGQTSRIRRGDGGAVTIDRDSLGRPLHIQIADSLGESIAYNANGNPVRATLLGNRVYGFTLNAHNLLSADSLTSAGIEFGRYTYDGVDRITSVKRPGRPTLSFLYDSAGRLASTESPATWARTTYVPGTMLPATVASSSGQSYGIQYDGTLPTFVVGSGLVTGSVEYLYSTDLLPRMVRITGRGASDYQYDRDGLILRGGALGLSRDSITGAITGDTIGLVGTTRQYDIYGRLQRVDVRVGGTTMYSNDLSRDPIGRITTSVDSSASGRVSMTFGYDVLDRLVTVSRNGSASEAYEYDLAGNRTRTTRPTGVSVVAYANDDRILSNDIGYFAHDPAGARLTQQQGGDSVVFAYDDFGRLVGLSSSQTGTLAFKLDAEGRRVQELRNGTIVRSFVYGLNTQPIAELDGSGSIRTEFVYVSGTNAPDYAIQNGKTLYLAKDQGGSVRFVIDVATGQTLQQLEYDAFGRITMNTNPALQPFAFGGGLADLDQRFAHFGARDYDAATGRWVEPDPVGAVGGSNRYVYAGNDPVNWSDPSGLCPKKACPGSIVFAGGTASDIIGGGPTGGGGLYIDLGTWSLGGYVRGGGGLGLDVSAGVEGGASESMKAFGGRSRGVCLGGGLAVGGSVCGSTNQAGKTVSGAIVWGTESVPAVISGNVNQTWTGTVEAFSVKEAFRALCAKAEEFRQQAYNALMGGIPH